MEKRRNEATVAYAPLPNANELGHTREDRPRTVSQRDWDSHSLLLLALPQHVLRHRDIGQDAESHSKGGQSYRLVEEPAHTHTHVVIRGRGRGELAGAWGAGSRGCTYSTLVSCCSWNGVMCVYGSLRSAYASPSVALSTCPPRLTQNALTSNPTRGGERRVGAATTRR